MRADALPVRPLGSLATLPPDSLAELFGAGARLRPSATVEVVRLGEVVGRVPVAAGDALRLRVDAATEVSGPVHLRGPAGALAVDAEAVRSRLVLPDGLRRAWGVGETAVLGLGPVALAVPVASGPDAVVEIERTLWLGAGRPETARWLSGVDLAPPAPEPADGPLVIERRVVTETDVRQARLKHRRIRLTPGQIVTPAAQTLAREAGVFVD
ncbi:hypothetical protein [Rubrivirga marina]|uniref:Uncharacterized protein n=1 Tax=Rubrivirga marina TaxID=1196024 RepID=A0A271J4X4_9BACT|nr:hypothetical protein [Rubrivirga marina]PAP78483.1 hypothetical protein BSZ37_19665 [Rubrivirga marina]